MIILGLDLDVNASLSLLDFQTLVPLDPASKDVADPTEHIVPTLFDEGHVETSKASTDDLLQPSQIDGSGVEPGREVRAGDLYARARRCEHDPENPPGALLP